MEKTETFCGLTISGDISGNDRGVDQRPIEELAPLVQAVLDDPLVASFGWTQYTPYFNDGDACVFRVGSVFALPAVAADNDGDGVDYSEDADVYGRDAGYFGRYAWQTGQYVGETQATCDRLLALSGAVESGAFDDALRELFGDHAKVTVTGEGITVDFYEHD